MKEIDKEAGFSENQYEFKRGGGSSIQAVQKARQEIGGGRWTALIILDIRNAFNMASRGIIKYLTKVKGNIYVP